MTEQTHFNSLAHILRERAATDGEQVGYTFLAEDSVNEARLTYGQLDRMARAIAVHLRDANATGGRAMLLYPPGLEFIAGLFGCWYAGVTAVPAYPRRSAQHTAALETLSALAKDSQPSAILTTASLISKINAAKIAHVPILATDQIDEQSAQQWQLPSSEALACLQYTSGSTGTPKGVILSHANLVANSAIIQKCFGHSRKSHSVIWLPPYHDMGLIGGILQPLYAGFPVTLMAPAAFLQRPARWLQAITRFGATTSGGPNFAYDLCVERISAEDRKTLDLLTWDVAFNGAETIDPGTLDRFIEAFGPCGFRREAFCPCYGLAEATLLVSGGEKSAPPVLQTIKNGEKSKDIIVVGCGRPRPNGSVVIVDPQMRTVCADKSIGEIWVHGGGIPQGYWQKPEQSQETFQARLSDSNEGPFLRTGDLGFIDDGELFVTGRLKDLIIIRGINHYPQDIEQTVQSSHWALRSGCGAAFSIDDGGRERVVILQELERTARDAEPQPIIHAIRETVAERHDVQVAAVVLLRPGQILKTSSGKIRRAACRQAFLNGTLESIAQWQQSKESEISSSPAVTIPANGPISYEEIEAFLTQKMADILKVGFDEIDPADTFARYGLDSLGAASLGEALKARLCREISITLFYDYPSAQELARHLAEPLKKVALA